MRFALRVGAVLLLAFACCGLTLAAWVVLPAGAALGVGLLLWLALNLGVMAIAGISPEDLRRWYSL